MSVCALDSPLQSLPIIYFPGLACPVLSCLLLPYPSLSYPVLPCSYLCPVLSCPTLPCLLLSHFLLSSSACPDLSKWIQIDRRNALTLTLPLSLHILQCPRFSPPSPLISFPLLSFSLSYHIDLYWNNMTPSRNIFKLMPIIA